MIVLKFGGSSVADALRIRQISKIINQYDKNTNLIVAVSALKGITNLLEESGSLALTGTSDFSNTLKTIEERHFEIINELIEPKNRTEIAAHIKMLCNEAEEICHGISILGEYSNRSKAKLLSIGERMSSGVISSSLNQLGNSNKLINSQEFLITDNNYLSARVNQSVSRAKTQKVFTQIEKLTIVPGFISSNSNVVNLNSKIKQDKN